MRALILPLAALCLLGACERRAPAPPTQARPAAEPLAFRDVRDIALRRVPGEIVGVELEGRERAVYEIRILTRSGRLVELKIDARTGAVLEQEAE